MCKVAIFLFLQFFLILGVFTCIIFTFLLTQINSKVENIYGARLDTRVLCIDLNVGDSTISDEDKNKFYKLSCGISFSDGTSKTVDTDIFNSTNISANIEGCTNNYIYIDIYCYDSDYAYSSASIDITNVYNAFQIIILGLRRKNLSDFLCIIQIIVPLFK